MGHSLGAARASMLAREEDRVQEIVLLVPAYFVRIDPTSRSFAHAGLKYTADLLLERPIP